MYPSWLCPQNFCDFDHFLQLVGWGGMGKLGRKRDNDRGIIFYACIYIRPDGSIAPTEYTHAVDQASALEQFGPLVAANRGRILAVAPAIDPHVAGGAENPGIIL
jgi:hypothetical protein